jgi:hypothetical protein
VEVLALGRVAVAVGDEGAVGLADSAVGAGAAVRGWTGEKLRGVVFALEKGIAEGDEAVAEPSAPDSWNGGEAGEGFESLPEILDGRVRISQWSWGLLRIA